MAEITITAANFEQEVLHSRVPVLLDFWAAWCGPCRMIAPTLAEISAQQEGKVKIGKVNVDEEMALAAKFGITSIPTLIVFKNGQITNQAVGAMPKNQIENLLK